MTNTLIAKITPFVTDMIRADHTKVVALFHQYKADSHPIKKKAFVESICTLLLTHSIAEDEIFYPAMREALPSVIKHRYDEQHEVEAAAETLKAMKPSVPDYDDRVYALMKSVLHHVAEEECVVLPTAERIFDHMKLGELGAKFNKRRHQLMIERMKPVERARDYVKDHPLQLALGGIMLAFAVAPLLMQQRGRV